MKKVLVSSVLLLALLVPMVACAKTPAAPAVPVTPAAPAVPAAKPAAPAPAQPTGELRIALSSLYEELLHPYRASAYVLYYLDQMYDYIIGTDDSGKLDPNRSIAYKWEVSDNQTDWTLYIRDGVKFHNGDTVTPQDIKFSIEEITAPKSINSKAGDFKTYIKSIEVVSPDKVLIHLNKPWLFLPYMLSDASGGCGLVLPQKYYNQVGEDYFFRHPIGTGPYRFKEQSLGSYIQFKAVDYPHWRAGVPKYNLITFLLVPEETTRVAMLRRGEADVVKVSVNSADELRKAGFLIPARKGVTTFQVLYLRSNPGFPKNPTSDPKVRQALEYAINKQELVDTIMKGFATTAGTFYAMTDWTIGYPGPEEAQRRWPPLTYDPAKAKQLLADAGYPKGFDLYLYSFVSILPEQKVLTQAIAGYWSKIGIKVNILEMDYAAFTAVWFKRQEPPGLPAAFGLASANAPYMALSPWAGKSGTDVVWDDKNAELVSKVDAQVTQKGYEEAYRTCYDYMYQQDFQAGVFQTDDIYAASKQITNWNMGKKRLGLNVEYLYRQK